jgi:hypothetical protein
VRSKRRGGCDALNGSGSTRGQGGVDEGSVFGLGHAIVDDQLQLIERKRVEHVVSDSLFLTSYLAFTG